MAPELTPEQREVAQEQILARWLALDASHRNERLTHERQRQGVRMPDRPTHPTRVVQTLTHQGQTKTLRQWAQLLEYDEHTLRCRIRRGWPPDRILAPKPQTERLTA